MVPTVVGQSYVVCVPAQKPTQQPHLRPLAEIGRRQRTTRVQLDVDRLDLAIHEVTAQPSDAQRRGAVRTGWATHYRADDIIENAGVMCHGLNSPSPRVRFRRLARPPEYAIHRTVRRQGYARLPTLLRFAMLQLAGQ